MAQEFATGGQLPEGASGGADESAHQDSSTRLEQFGVGVSASILLGAVVGVAATASVDAGGLPLLVALGIGFILSPLVGLLFLRRAE
ncbi:hypothetical protein [Halobellus captivus]|uniref:hypothetical protein n=1 Tax=Halobellus captivus TaxID=2592614 RepID=UPI0011AAB07C|nr:hypothetical protein [Halobellus captivus]